MPNFPLSSRAVIKRKHRPQASVAVTLAGVAGLAAAGLAFPSGPGDVEAPGAAATAAIGTVRTVTDASGLATGVASVAGIAIPTVTGKANVTPEGTAIIGAAQPVVEVKTGPLVSLTGASSSTAIRSPTVQPKANISTYVGVAATGHAGAATVPQDPYWLVSEPYALPAAGWSTGAAPVTGTGATYPLAQHATDPDGDPMAFNATSITAVGFSDTSGITVDPSTGVLTVSASTPSDSYSVQVDLSPAVDAVEQDWIDRSTADGVIWAHDFREPDEVQAFVRTSHTGMEVSATVLKPNQVPKVQANGFGKSGVLLQRISGATLTDGLAAASVNETVNIRISTPTDWPQAVESDETSHYTCLIGNLVASRAFIKVVQGPWFESDSWWLRVFRDAGEPSVPAGDSISLKVNDWERILGPLPAGINGKSLPDQGLATYPADYSKWLPNDTARHSKFQGFYWAHPTVGVRGSSFSTVPNAYMGDEFYIQYLVKWDANIFRHVSGKSFYLQCANTSSRQQWFGDIGPKNSRYSSPDPTWATVYGTDTSEFNLVTDGQSAGSTFAGSPWDEDLFIDYGTQCFQPGSEYPAIEGATSTTCWMWPSNKWVSVLMHVKPGGLNYYAQLATLTAPLPQADYWQGDGVTRNYPTEDVEFTDLSAWPDPAGTPYYIHIRQSKSLMTVQPSGTDSVIEEVMRVNSITGNTMNVTRNIYRTNRVVGGTNGTYSVIVDDVEYGPYTYGWQDDPRLSPHHDMLMEVKVAIEGEQTYTTVFSMNDIPIKSSEFDMNPCAYNAFRPTFFPNHYPGGNPAWPFTATARFTQVILSKNAIGVPVWPT